MPIFAIVWVLIATGVTPARTQTPGDVPPIFAGVVRPLQPPPEPGGWVLQVITRGGIGGRGSGDFAISSTGSLPFPAPEGPRVVPANDLRLLREYVSTSTPSQWTARPVVSFCSDCVSTLMVLTLRTAAGTVHTYSAAWDQTTKGTVSEDARRIHHLALEVTRTRTK
jgi:hypothetical protein